MTTLKHVLDSLQKLESTGSTNAKVAILTELLKDELFYKVVVYTLDDLKHYNTNIVRPYVAVKPYAGTPSTPTVDSLFLALDSLILAKGATAIDKERLFRAASIDVETYEVMKRIVNKDLRCGVSAKLVNKARPKTLHIVPYCRCSSQSKAGNLIYPAVVQEKADGMFVNVQFGIQNPIITRNGKEVHQLGVLKSKIALIPTQWSDNMGMGELRIMRNGVLLDRKTGNGILNQCLQGTANQEDADNAVLCLWDVVPLQMFWDGVCKTPYITRLENLKRMLHSCEMGGTVSLIKTIHANSVEEADEFYRKIRLAGGEGDVRKNYKATWQFNTSPDMIKTKNIMDVELRMVGWYPGNPGTKYEHMMGGISCVSECGKLAVNIGTGFSDAERAEDWDGRIGKIMGLACESVITSKGKGQASLFLPRYFEVREDKSVADTLKELLER